MIQNGSYESFSNELGTLLIWLQLWQKQAAYETASKTFSSLSRFV